MDHDGHAKSLGGLVDRPQGREFAIHVGICRKELVGWMDLHAAHFPLRGQPFDVSSRVLRSLRMDRAEWDQAFAILHRELADETVRVFREAHHFGGDVVDQASPFHAGAVQMVEEGPRVSKQAPDAFNVWDPIEHQFPDGGFELGVGFYMEVDIRDSGHGAPYPGAGEIPFGYRLSPWRVLALYVSNF